MQLLLAHYLSTGAIFDQVRSNNRMSPINRTHNHQVLDIHAVSLMSEFVSHLLMHIQRKSISKKLAGVLNTQRGMGTLMAVNQLSCFLVTTC